MGCRTGGELLERTTRMSRSRVQDSLRAARGVRRAMAPSSGELLEPEFPALRSALAEAVVGVDAANAIVGSLTAALPRAGRSAVLAADEELAASARGDGADAAPPAIAEELRTMAQVWAIVLDQDGAEPRETDAARRRGVTLGRARDGVIPLRGFLLPEVAGQLQTLFDSILNPKAAGPTFVSDSPASSSDSAHDGLAAPLDPRSRAQQQHDAFAAITAAAAGSVDVPTLGGSAPTLVVSVRESDLASGTGWAHVDGCEEPVSIAAARHVACSGSVTRVVTAANGKIVSIATLDRVFNHHQRRAIALRDGGCIIPGCRVPATWCEVHHVDEHSRGGPTHTSNGVLLCWHHHRTLDSGGWVIRMNDGVPEIRGPSWWDPYLRWRAVTSSRTRMRDRVTSRSAAVRS